MVSVTTKKEWAVAYARAGLKVFPCFEIAANGRCSCYGKGNFCTPGKHPRTEHGLSDATDDIRQIERWWTQWPDANIGAAMAKSGLIGVDIDPRHGGDESWAQFRARHPNIPVTWTNLTGGGGEQLYFAVPPNFDHRGDSLPGYPGIDIKYNGYGILPPSNHQSGRAYAWEVGYSPFDFSVPAMIPPAIEDTITRKPGKDDVLPSDGPKNDVTDLLKQTIAEGGRHNAMHSIVSWLRNVMDLERATLMALSINTTNFKPPLSEREVVEHVADVFRRYPDPATAIIDDEPPPPPSSPDDWKLIRGRDLRTMQLPPVEWLLEGMIPAGKYVVLSGDSGLGKSWWMLLFILCATQGLPFLGKQTAPMRALYIDEENGVQEAQRRLRALADGIGIPEDADLGVDFLIDESVKPGKELHRTRLAELIKRERYTFIATDSLIRFFDGNENNSDEVKRFHESIDWVKRQTGVGWGMLQHLNKAGKAGGEISAGDRLRGSGEFKAHADVHIQLRTVDNGATIITHVEKLRGGVKPADVVYRMDGNTMLDEPVVFTLLETTAAAYGARNSAIMYACELLENAGPLTVSELKRFLRDRYSVAERTAELALAHARKSGVIVVDKKVKNSVYLKLGAQRDE